MCSSGSLLPELLGKPDENSFGDVANAERAIASQAEASYQRMVSDWKAARPQGKKKGAGATTGVRI